MNQGNYALEDSTPELDPSGRSAHESGSKLDLGKPKVVRGVLHSFPLAIMKVAEVTEFGAAKYTYDGWKTVEDGVARYEEAEVRHIIKRALEGDIDSDSQMLHLAHQAWNALATLELFLREQRNG